jgi:long-chain acyl-CoA synthetase
VTLFELFADAARVAGDRPAIRLKNSAVSYAELQERVLRRAAQMDARLQRPGGIAIILRDRVELLTAFLACAAVGRPAAPVDPDMPPARIETILAGHFAGLLRDPDVRLGGCGLTELAISSGDEYPVPAIRRTPEAEFYWGQTSGTTGEPKLVARSHASWIASFEAGEQVFDFGGGETVLAPGPLHHSLFLYGAVHALCRGHCVALPPAKFRAGNLCAFGASHLYAVPFMLGKLASERRQMPGLRQIFCGGAKLDPSLRETCEALWPDTDLVEFYGSTETSFVTFHSTKNPGSQGSVGRIFPGVRIEIRDESGGPVEKSESGEIFAASDMLLDRYVGGERAGSWVSVGDMGWLDAENCLHLTGRSNRIINSKGLKIHPEQIEAALASRSEIESSAVIAMPDPIRGEAAVAVIVFKAGHHTERATLSAFCRAEFGEGYSPLRFYESKHLPQTPSGKVALAAIADALTEGDATYRELV